MKNLRNYVILSAIIVMVVLVGMAQGVNASGTVLFPSSTSTTTTNDTNTNTSTNFTLTENTAGNSTGASSTNTSTQPATNSIIVNNINNNVAKDTNVTNTTTPAKNQIPQTGENDVYIVSAIGVVALAIGTVAYLKSRKYDI